MAISRIIKNLTLLGIVISIIILVHNLGTQDIAENEVSIMESEQDKNTAEARDLQRNQDKNLVESGIKLLTIFTSFKEDKTRDNIQSNTVLNWAELGPNVQQVAFTNLTEGKVIETAKRAGWNILKIPRASEYGMPFFKDMFLTAEKQFPSIWYGFANADILFTEHMVQTLQAVSNKFSNISTLVVGQRKDLQTNPDDSTPFYRLQNVVKMGKSAKYFSSIAIDYFFISNVNMFPWEKLPDVVIGKPRYDNFMLQFAHLNNITVVDATKSTLALHQNGNFGKFPGHKAKDFKYNIKLIGEFHDDPNSIRHLGSTWGARYFTEISYRIVVKSRNT